MDPKEPPKTDSQKKLSLTKRFIEHSEQVLSKDKFRATKISIEDEVRKARTTSVPAKIEDEENKLIADLYNSHFVPSAANQPLPSTAAPLKIEVPGSKVTTSHHSLGIQSSNNHRGTSEPKQSTHES